MSTDFLGRKLREGPVMAQRTPYDDAQRAQTILGLQSESCSIREKIKGTKQPSGSRKAGAFGADLKPLAQVQLQVRQTLRGHMAKVYAMQWSADSLSLVSASQDGKLIVWDPRENNKLYLVPLISRWVMTCAYAPSNELVACGGLENICSVYQLTREGGSRLRQELGGHDAYIACCRFVDNKSILTASADNTCRLYDCDTSKRVTSFVGHTAGCMYTSMRPNDASTFVSASCDSSAKLWDVRTPRCLETYPGHKAAINSVEFLSSGYQFISGSDDGTCRLFDIRCDEQLAVYENPSLPEISSVGVSKSGRLLFVGDDSMNCTVWDVLRQERVGMLGEHTNRVQCLGVAGDGLAICTGSWDGLLRVWN
ncbi:guanine nucleotide-binding protein subunit beta-1 [Aphelenchoides avenae]|nr:guanine nucleotide-binding protein subunit beta-1 [Aphelenchus avenae]